MKNESFDAIKLKANSGIIRILVAVSGYESRSHHVCELLQQNSKLANFSKVLILGFSGFKNHPSRVSSDAFYASLGIQIHHLEDDSTDRASKSIKTELDLIRRSNSDSSFELHVDYSSMPRSWYCTFASLFPKWLTSLDRVYFWYSYGQHNGMNIPTAGVDDFIRFAGKPKLSPSERIHIIGLGFDKVRSSAIAMVLDPKHIVTFYGVDPDLPDYKERVLSDNADILRKAEFNVGMPIYDFIECYGRLQYIIRDYSRRADVIVVPDGPKPLVLASSLIVLQQTTPGVVCLHVKRRRSMDSKPTDLPGCGRPVGFSLPGLADTN